MLLRILHQIIREYVDGYVFLGVLSWAAYHKVNHWKSLWKGMETIYCTRENLLCCKKLDIRLCEQQIGSPSKDEQGMEANQTTGCL